MPNVMEVWIESREEILKNARWSDKCGGGGSDKCGGGSDKCGGGSDKVGWWE